MPTSLHSLTSTTMPSPQTIAQTYLKADGYYTGTIDGDWGPLSRTAAAAWAAAKLPQAGRTPYALAQQYLGTREIPGSKHNSTIVGWLRRIATWINDDETAWCSAFINAMAEDAGFEKSGKLNARSWLDVGQKVTAAEAKRGDVVILWRVSRNGWQGHVGFVQSINASTVSILGGNQGNAVTITKYPLSRVLGCRRLRKASTSSLA